MGLAQAAAQRTGTPLALGSLCHQMYRAMEVNGLNAKDFSVVYPYIRGEHNKL